MPALRKQLLHFAVFFKGLSQKNGWYGFEQHRWLYFATCAAQIRTIRSFGIDPIIVLFCAKKKIAS